MQYKTYGLWSNSYFSACIFTVDWTVLDHTLRKLCFVQLIPLCSVYNCFVFVFVSLLAFTFYTNLLHSSIYSGFTPLHLCMCVCNKDCHCTYDKHKELKKKKGFKSLKLNLKENNVCIESAYYQYLISHPSISWVYSYLF